MLLWKKKKRWGVSMEICLNNNDTESLLKELKRIAEACRLQERIITQMQIRQLIERVRNGNGSR